MNEIKKHKAFRLLGAAGIADGLALTILGKSYLRMWRLNKKKGLYHRVLTWLLDLPTGMLRLIGLVETGVGLAMVGKAPLKVRELYKATAYFYDIIDPWWRTWLYPKAHRDFDRAVASHLPPEGRVLDLGCGTGANLAQLLDMDVPFDTYVGVDVSAAMLARARDTFGEREDVTFRQLDIERSLLPEGPFDLILSTWTFEHLSNPHVVVQKARSVLRPGGYMVLLFEVKTDRWWARLWYRVLRFLAARAIPEEVYRNFPELITVERYPGPYGDLALVMLRKPGATGQKS